MANSSPVLPASLTPGQSDELVRHIDEILMHRRNVVHRRGSPEFYRQEGETNGLRLAMRIIQGTRIPVCIHCQTHHINDHENQDRDIYHCNEGHHCTAMDAYCAAQSSQKDHPTKCCFCGAEMVKRQPQNHLEIG